HDVGVGPLFFKTCYEASRSYRGCDDHEGLFGKTAPCGIRGTLFVSFYMVIIVMKIAHLQLHILKEGCDQ
ncbi:hypothetical protein, partial [Geobacillus stearothermophilus]|uniref:hypothetical protein n=1 Tax=Geobacillus stearothermophilus TaxID=1422 RepID=UPI00399C8215